MIIGSKIAIPVVELRFLRPLVTATSVAGTMISLKDELVELVNRMPLESAGFTVSSLNFELKWDFPLTFDTSFGCIVRRTKTTMPTTLSVVDEAGLISNYAVMIDPNAAVYIPVVGQLIRSLYLRRLYNLIESSSRKAQLLADIDLKIADLCNTPMILAPVADECFGASDGAIYMYRDTITPTSDFFITLPFGSLPPQLVADFRFIRADATSSLYKLPGYEAGMNTGIEDALMNRGALSKMDDSSKWLHVSETLDRTVSAAAPVVSILAYEAPRVLALLTLARRVSMMGSEVNLSLLDAGTMQLLKTLRKISNKNEFVVLSVTELLHDVIELAPILTNSVVDQSSFIQLYCRFTGVTRTTAVFTGSATEANKRLVRTAIAQWRYDLGHITGLTATVDGSTIVYKNSSAATVATVTFEGPFAAAIASIEVSRTSTLQKVIDDLAAMAGLVDTANIGKVFGISPSTNELSFSYTIDQLKASVAEVLIDTTRALYKRSV